MINGSANGFASEGLFSSSTSQKNGYTNPINEKQKMREAALSTTKETIGSKNTHTAVIN
jgi:hypothetical protein